MRESSVVVHAQFVSDAQKLFPKTLYCLKTSFCTMHIGSANAAEGETEYALSQKRNHKATSKTWSLHKTTWSDDLPILLHQQRGRGRRRDTPHTVLFCLFRGPETGTRDSSARAPRNKEMVGHSFSITVGRRCCCGCYRGRRRGAASWTRLTRCGIQEGTRRLRGRPCKQQPSRVAIRRRVRVFGAARPLGQASSGLVATWFSLARGAP